MSVSGKESLAPYNIRQTNMPNAYLLAQETVLDLYRDGLLTYENLLDNLARIDKQYASQ